MARGDGRIYLRGAWKWVCYYRDGEQFREPAKGKDGRNTNDPKEAAKFLKSKVDAITTEKGGGPAFVPPKASKLTVAELVEALRTDFQLRGKGSPQNLSALKRVTTDLGEYRAAKLSAEQISIYMQERVTAGNANASVNRTLELLSQAYKLAVKRKRLSSIPSFTPLPEDNTREGFFDEAQARAVLAHLPDDGLRDFVLFAYLVGWRKGSIAKLRWSSVDLEAGEILLPGKYVKNRKPLKMAIEGELRDLLERRAAARSVEKNGVAEISEFVFHRSGVPVREFRKSWATACRLAECPERLLHDFRRTCARDLIRSGVDESVAMRYTGHRTNNIFKRYNISDSDDLREALHRVATYRSEQATAKQKVVAIGARG